jgi:hypothetical protein
VLDDANRQISRRQVCLRLLAGVRHGLGIEEGLYRGRRGWSCRCTYIFRRKSSRTSAATGVIILIGGDAFGL